MPSLPLYAIFSNLVTLLPGATTPFFGTANGLEVGGRTPALVRLARENPPMLGFPATPNRPLREILHPTPSLILR